jgi:hypothetical protein
MIVADQLGVPLDAVTVIYGDTDLVPQGVGTFGSRSLQLGGTAVHDAAVSVLAQARDLAADLLEASADDVVLDKDSARLHVAGDASSGLSWSELAAAAAGREAVLSASSHFVPQGPTFPFGAHLAVVEVDTGTGKVTLRSLTTVDDAGRILNPLLVEGQRHGGLAQGVAQALVEEMRYDADALQPAGGQGHRGGRHDRRHPRGPERRHRRGRAPRRTPHRPADDLRTGLARDHRGVGATGHEKRVAPGPRGAQGLRRWWFRRRERSPPGGPWDPGSRRTRPAARHPGCGSRNPRSR